MISIHDFQGDMVSIIGGGNENQEENTELDEDEKYEEEDDEVNINDKLMEPKVIIKLNNK